MYSSTYLFNYIHTELQCSVIKQAYIFDSHQSHYDQFPLKIKQNRQKIIEVVEQLER